MPHEECFTSTSDQLGDIFNWLEYLGQVLLHEILFGGPVCERHFDVVALMRFFPERLWVLNNSICNDGIMSHAVVPLDTNLLPDEKHMADYDHGFESNGRPEQAK